MSTKVVANGDDQVLTCVECREQFVFTQSEQRFYAEKELNTPKRCLDCRKKRKAEREKGIS